MLLLERIGPKVRQLAYRPPPTAGAADAEVAAQLNAKLEQLRGRLHADMEAVVQTLGGSGIQVMCMACSSMHPMHVYTCASS